MPEEVELRPPCHAAGPVVVVLEAAAAAQQLAEDQLLLQGVGQGHVDEGVSALIRLDQITRRPS